MTAPVTTPPTCSVWIDGKRMADGQPGEPDDAPCVLTDLKITWGRSNTFDQPAPGSATFKVMDLAGGQRFLDVIRLGSAVGIRTEGTVWADPTVVMLPLGFGPATYYNAVVTPAGAARSLAPASGPDAMYATVPPAAYSSDPSAWNAVARSKAHQTWRLSGTVTLQTDLGTKLQRVTIRPVAYTNPNGSDALTLDPILTIGPGLTGAQSFSVDFTPPDDVWVGIQYEIWPTGPRWQDLAADLTWASLPAGAATRTNLATNPGYEIGTGSILTGSSGNYVISGDTTAPIAGPRSALLTRAGNTSTIVAQILCTTGAAGTKISVTAGQPITAGLTVKTDVANGRLSVRWFWYDSVGTLTQGASTTLVPEMVAGATYRAISTGVPPAGTVSAWYVVYVNTPSGNVVGGERVWADQLTIESGTTDGSYFDGDTPDVPGGVTYAWTGTPNGSTSTAIDQPSVRWVDLSTAILGAPTLLAPASGVARAALVFSGRVTDLVASYDTGIGGTVVNVIASDYLAGLANRYVGDTPWAAEPLWSRFTKIVSTAGLTIKSDVDPAPAALTVSYRDVDSQPVGRLLQELAVSAAGVLWAATNLVTGEYLWLEDIGSRAPLQVLTKDPDGVIRIHTATAAALGAVEISACSLLLEPVEWEQTYSDYSTQVSLTWLDQVTDPGPPATIRPTSREILVTDATAETLTGRRRLGVGTQLSVQAEAQSIADMILARVRSPGWRISGLTWDMGPQEQLTQAELGVVLTILDGTTRLGLPILLTDLPEWSPVGKGPIPLYLEGARLSHHAGYWTIELLTSDARNQGSAAIPWTALPAGWLWNQFDPEISWDELAGVGIA